MRYRFEDAEIVEFSGEPESIRVSVSKSAIRIELWVIGHRGWEGYEIDEGDTARLEESFDCSVPDKGVLYVTLMEDGIAWCGTHKWHTKIEGG